ncbi:MAG: PSD1 domain-containing protein [Verrucomicrobiae bacterium]|nr:PSD1 domain-containing protein [Verrucomicrobiae bacterium]
MYSLTLIAACNILLVSTSLFAQNGPTKIEQVDFVEDIQPVFRQHCYECHAGNTEKAELNLAIRAKAMKGGKSSVAIVPGDSHASLLVERVTEVDVDKRMPPEGKEPLSSKEIGLFRAWIDQGAKWPDGNDVADPRLDRAREHWSFQRLRDVPLPEKLATDTWSKTAIDLFASAQLHESGIGPSEPASARILVRRIYFDLAGLPPTPEQTRQFVIEHAIDPATATSSLVANLLDSNQYGERWARHWLDVARYADSAGQEADQDRPHAWRYRDFVIKALNEDMPYDEFVRWQLAGDEYEPENDQAISATGFLTSGTSFKLNDNFIESERLLNRYNELDDIVSTVGTGLLGITTGCARCHDHKYDAFSAREYYQLVRVFHSGDRTTGKLPSGSDGFFFKDFDAEPRTTWLFRRSDFYDREIEVELGFPALVSFDRTADDYWNDARSKVEEPTSTLQRRAFAEWITDVEHGAGALLARVIVNRVWQHHFGHGIVRTPADLGVRGEAPSHPELLEYLVGDFVKHGWKLKRLHRKILSSSVWQQGSSNPAATLAARVDPQNRLLWKMAPQRLEAEALRDAMLAVSGTLNFKAGGPGFKPYIQPEANLARNIQGEAYPQDAKDDASTRRRSVYMFHKRLIPYPLFQAFDRPDLMNSCSQRQNTTVAPQAMAILNDTFVRAVSRDFAKRLTESGDDRSAIQNAFAAAFAREPTETELTTSLAFIELQANSRTKRNEEGARHEAMADFCQSLFGLNEFIYVD